MSRPVLPDDIYRVLNGYEGRLQRLEQAQLSPRQNVGKLLVSGGVGATPYHFEVQTDGAPGNRIAGRFAGGDLLLDAGASIFFDANWAYASGNYIQAPALNTQTFTTAGKERFRIDTSAVYQLGNAPWTTAMLDHVLAWPGGQQGAMLRKHFKNLAMSVNPRKLSIGYISGDAANWASGSGLEITIRTQYYGGGSKTRSLIGYAYMNTFAGQLGDVAVLEATGPQPIVPKVGPEVVISGTIKEREVFIEIPPWMVVGIEVDYSGYNVVNRPFTAGGQLAWTGTDTEVVGGSFSYYGGSEGALRGTKAVGKLRVVDGNVDLMATAAGLEALKIRNGNTQLSNDRKQIVFGFEGTDNYKHSMTSRHNATGRANNAIDFHLWRQGTDAAGAIGSLFGMTIEDTPRGPRVRTPGMFVQDDDAVSVWIGNGAQVNTTYTCKTSQQLWMIWGSAYCLAVQQAWLRLRINGTERAQAMIFFNQTGVHMAMTLGLGYSDHAAGTSVTVVTDPVACSFDGNDRVGVMVWEVGT